MKKILLFSLLSVIILNGCSTRNSSQQVNTVFEKKQECAEYMQNHFNEILRYKYGINNEDEIYYTNDANSFFYSPKLNTCVYTFRDMSSTIRKYYIIDMLESKEIYYTSFNEKGSEDLGKIQQDFFDQIESLK